MLAEKFFLALETIISRRHSEDASRVMSNSRHVPVKLPANDFLQRRSGTDFRAQGLPASKWVGVPEEKTVRRDVLSRLATLPDDQRAVLLLVAVEDLSYSAVANVLNLPIDVVMSCLSQARERLQGEAEERADAALSNVVRLRAPK
jgi:DNA-directed RNA polymerase specialized sigma24 family protein